MKPAVEQPQGNADEGRPGADSTEPQVCDHCGSDQVRWVKCKLICRNCRQIVKSCADL